MGHTFLFLCMFLIFLLLDNWTFESNNYVTLEISFSSFHRACWLSYSCFWFCLLVIVSCLCWGSAWAIIWRFFSEPFPECMWSCSDLSLICSCFWVSQSLLSGFQKREKRKMKEGGAGHLNSLEVTPTWRRRGMPQCREVLLQACASVVIGSQGTDPRCLEDSIFLGHPHCHGLCVGCPRNTCPDACPGTEGEGQVAAPMLSPLQLPLKASPWKYKSSIAAMFS